MATAFIVDVGDALNLMLCGQIGDVGHEVGLVDAVGNLRDNDLVVLLATLNLSLGTHDNTSAPRLIGIAHALQAIDIGARREVGAWDILHQPVRINVRIVDEGAAAIDDLAQIVGRHIGGHTHGNAVAAVDQQVGHLRRHDAGLDERIVEVGIHVDRIFVEVVHDVLAHLREAALRVTHGSGRIAVDRSEVALSVDERIAHVPLLAHAHQCAID